MIGWLILIGYAAGFVVTVPKAYLSYIDMEARHRLSIRYKPETDDSPLVDNGDRAIGLLVGVLAAALWPVALVLMGTMRMLRGLESPTEAAHRERLELEALRAQARKLGLPMPAEDRDA